jgi:hypothetical protein
MASVLTGNKKVETGKNIEPMLTVITVGIVLTCQGSKGLDGRGYADGYTVGVAQRRHLPLRRASWRGLNRWS